MYHFVTHLGIRLCDDNYIYTKNMKDQQLKTKTQKQVWIGMSLHNTCIFPEKTIIQFQNIFTDIIRLKSSQQF